MKVHPLASPSDPSSIRNKKLEEGIELQPWRPTTQRLSRKDRKVHPTSNATSVGEKKEEKPQPKGLKKGRKIHPLPLPLSSIKSNQEPSSIQETPRPTKEWSSKRARRLFPFPPTREEDDDLSIELARKSPSESEKERAERRNNFLLKDWFVDPDPDVPDKCNLYREPLRRPALPTPDDSDDEKPLAPRRATTRRVTFSSRTIDRKGIKPWRRPPSPRPNVKDLLWISGYWRSYESYDKVHEQEIEWLISKVYGIDPHPPMVVQEPEEVEMDTDIYICPEIVHNPSLFQEIMTAICLFLWPINSAIIFFFAFYYTFVETPRPTEERFMKLGIE